MNGDPFRIVPLDSKYDRSLFQSGNELLDIYFRDRVIQDIRRRITACFIALDRSGNISGYYTLSSASIYLHHLQEKLIAKLPRYPQIPAVRMGRLAVQQAYKGRGLGAALLSDAIMRVIQSEIAAYALIVDAKDNEAAAFYSHHGFLELVGESMQLFLPMATAVELLHVGVSKFNP